MKILVKIKDGKVVVPNIGNRSQKRFLKSRRGQGYKLVEMEKSKFGFYKLDETGKVIVDTERTLAKEAELQKLFFKKKITEMLEAKAKELGFDELKNIGTYMTEEDNALKAPANALGKWAGNVWGTVIQIEQRVESGEIEAPHSWEELEALLPPFGNG